MFKRLTTLTIAAVAIFTLTLTTEAVADPANAAFDATWERGPNPANYAPWEHHSSSQRRAARFGTCQDCLPPQVDALLLRPVALFGAGPFALAAFVLGVPFVTFADAQALPAYFDATLGDTLRYVFTDPLGTH